MKRSRKVRILLAKPGLDGHDVGAKIVARGLMEAGFEVIYTGLKKSPEQIAHRAREENVDVIALSILSGSHLPICRRLKTLFAEGDLQGVLWIVGGSIPPGDLELLKSLGIDGVFPVGTTTQSVVEFIRKKLP